MCAQAPKQLVYPGLEGARHCGKKPYSTNRNNLLFLNNKRFFLVYLTPAARLPREALSTDMHVGCFPRRTPMPTNHDDPLVFDGLRPFHIADGYRVQPTSGPAGATAVNRSFTSPFSTKLDFQRRFFDGTAPPFMGVVVPRTARSKRPA